MPLVVTLERTYCRDGLAPHALASNCKALLQQAADALRKQKATVAAELIADADSAMAEVYEPIEESE